MLNELKKKSLEALLEINNRDLFEGLGVCRWDTQLGKTPDVFKRRKKSLKLLIVKGTFLRNITPAFLDLGLVQDVRQSG